MKKDAVYEKMDPYEKIYNTIMGDLYPYLLSRQKTGISKVDSSPCIKAVGTLGARRATRVGAAFDYHSGRVKGGGEWIHNHGLEWFHSAIYRPRGLTQKFGAHCYF